MQGDQDRKHAVFPIYGRDGSREVLLFLHAQNTDLLFHFLRIFHAAAGIIGDDTELDRTLEGEPEHGDMLLQGLDTEASLTIQPAVLIFDIHVCLQDGFTDIAKCIITQQRTDMTADIAAETGIGIRFGGWLYEML